MHLAHSTRETLVGACVFVVAGVILSLSYAGHRAQLPGYDLITRFHKADGIGPGSEVRLAGVVVGKVVAQALDKQFRAVLTLRLAPTVSLPTDSAAVIQTDGLLGGKYITLQPGGDDAVLKPGAEITLTQDSMNLEDILNMVIAQGESRQAATSAKEGTAH